MFKRVLAIIGVFSLLVISASAYEWHGESFLDDYYGAAPASEYSISPDTDIPSLFSLDRSVSRAGSSSQSLSGVDLLDSLTLVTPCSIYVSYTTKPIVVSPSYTIPGTNLTASVPSNGMSLFRYRINSFGEYVWVFDGGISPGNPGSDGSTYLYDMWPNYYVSTFSSVLPYQFSLDLSSFSSFSSFELSGLLSGFSFVGPSFSNYLGGPALACQLFVNERYVHTFSASSGVFDFAHYIYQGSEPVTSVSLFFSYTQLRFSHDASVVYDAGLGFSSFDSFSFSVLSDDIGSSLDGFYQDNQAAQDSMSDYDQIENQWTTNMTDTWNQLDIGNFSFDSGLVSAFGLFSGIFNDIWNIFGTFSLFFIFPLILGIVLTVIGRLSRTGGKGGKT